MPRLTKALDPSRRRNPWHAGQSLRWIHKDERIPNPRDAAAFISNQLSCGKRYDNNYDVTLGRHWAEVLTPGISAMKQAY